MNVLFIVTHFDSANGFCVKSVAKHLAATDAKVFILTQAGTAAASQNGRENDYKIFTVASGIVARLQSKLPALSKGIFARAAQLLHRFWFLLCYPRWPMTSPLLANKLFAKAEEIVLSEEINVVVPVYNAVEALIAGQKLKGKYGHLIYIPYFLDALNGGQTPRFMRKHVKQKKALRWEKKLLSNAEGVVMMASAQKSYKNVSPQPEYLKKTAFLDIPMLNIESVTQENKESAPSPKDEVVFLFAGSMPRNIRDPEALLNLFSSVDVPNWRLHFVGPTDFENVIDDAAKRDPRIRRIGKVSHEQAVQMMEDADFLVNIGNTLSYMVPSKIFEYMSFNKPIISTYKIADDPCLPYLKHYGKAVVIDERSDVQNNADILRHFVNQTERAALASADIFELAKPGMPLYNNTPAAFAEYLQQICAKELNLTDH